VSTRQGNGATTRHHSSFTTGLALKGVCEGNDRFEQFGPEQGWPGIGAQGERPVSAGSFNCPILRMASEFAAAMALARSTELPG
jgi:hypothetical protein